MTKQSFKFNVAEVKCNGVSGASMIHIDNQKIIQTYISTYRQVVDFCEIVENLSDDGWDHYYGSRCKDDSTIAARIFTALQSYANQKFEDRLLAEMWINSQIENMPAKDLNVLITEALRDCSSADHWYTFEKEWE